MSERRRGVRLTWRRALSGALLGILAIPGVAQLCLEPNYARADPEGYDSLSAWSMAVIGGALIVAGLWLLSSRWARRADPEAEL